VRKELPLWRLEGETAFSSGAGQPEREGVVGLLDARAKPARIDITWKGYGTLRCIYARAGEYLILCGNKDEPAPTEFKEGTVDGGLFLAAWKIGKE
jgi:hypothetical protein